MNDDLLSFDWNGVRRTQFTCHLTPETRATLERIFVTEKREYSRDEPVALDDRDPGNSDPADFTAALDPDDDVLKLVYQDQGDLLESAPMQNPRYGDQS